jgi:predicted nucleotidyltransferase
MIVGQRHVALSEINDTIQVIVKKFSPDKIILFGSHAKGHPNSDSDVDLLVIIDTNRSTWDLSVEISLALKHSFPMDIIVRTPQEIARRLKDGDFFMKNIMENGKVLYERSGR